MKITGCDLKIAYYCKYQTYLACSVEPCEAESYCDMGAVQGHCLKALEQLQKYLYLIR